MSTVSSVSPSATTSPSSTTNTANGVGQLTQQDFLKILVTQFTSQDPFSDSSGGSGGSSGSDYVTQLMNMTNLTTMQTMSSQMTTSTQQQAMLIAQTLPGATVELNNKGSLVQGQVEKARVSGSDVYLTVGGQEYPSTTIISIDKTAQQAAASSTSTTN